MVQCRHPAPSRVQGHPLYAWKCARARNCDRVAGTGPRGFAAAEPRSGNLAGYIDSNFSGAETRACPATFLDRAFESGSFLEKTARQFSARPKGNVAVPYQAGP